MCGRYAVFLPPDAMAALFSAGQPVPNFPPTWNLAPTHDAPVVRVPPDMKERRLDLLRWGFLPYWAKPSKFGRQPINARAETLATGQTFRDSFQRRRCLVPADVFYEWQTVGTQKQPWAIARADRQTMAFGGVWDAWRSPEGQPVRTFAIVTRPSVPALQPIHHRMPLILDQADWPLWLGETEGDPIPLLRGSSAEFASWRISSSVNHVRNNSAELLEPLHEADRQASLLSG